MNQSRGRIIIVGGGPVGLLSAVFLGRRGYKVDLYEARSDIRIMTDSFGKSINLDLSHRGLSALEHVGLDKEIIAVGKTFSSRYVHAKDGGHYLVPYCKKEEQLLISINRLELNRKLLTLAECSKNVQIHFEHKMVHCDLKMPSATFKKANGELCTEKSDLLVGCDGAHSAVRGQMLKGRMDFSQMYIGNGYKEFRIKPTLDEDYALFPNHIHVWPRGKNIMIAMANLDNSLTASMVMPYQDYEKMATADDFIDFFKDNFEDSIPLIGEDALRESFLKMPLLPLVTIKCGRYHYDKTTVLLGDAAHTVVPFYAQGVNCGLEDVLIFDELMDTFDDDFSKVLPAFSKIRVRAGHTIADMSLSSYKFVSTQIASPWFLFRKRVDDFLHFLIPSIFIPRYNMVTFTRIPYDEAAARADRQDKIVDALLVTIAGISMIIGACMSWKIYFRLMK